MSCPGAGSPGQKMLSAPQDLQQHCSRRVPGELSDLSIFLFVLLMHFPDETNSHLHRSCPLRNGSCWGKPLRNGSGNHSFCLTFSKQHLIRFSGDAVVLSDPELHSAAQH